MVSRSQGVFEEFDSHKFNDPHAPPEVFILSHLPLAFDTHPYSMSLVFGFFD